MAGGIVRVSYWSPPLDDFFFLEARTTPPVQMQGPPAATRKVRSWIWFRSSQRLMRARAQPSSTSMFSAGFTNLANSREARRAAAADAADTVMHDPKVIPHLFRS